MHGRILKYLFGDHAPGIADVPLSKPENLRLRVPRRRAVDGHFLLGTPCFTGMAHTTNES